MHSQNTFAPPRDVAGGGCPTTSPAQPEGIEKQIEMLHNKVVLLHGSITTLYERLNHVMAPIGPSGEKSAAKEGKYLPSKVEQDLDNITTGIDAARESLHILLSHIRL